MIRSLFSIPALLLIVLLYDSTRTSNAFGNFSLLIEVYSTPVKLVCIPFGTLEFVQIRVDWGDNSTVEEIVKLEPCIEGKDFANGIFHTYAESGLYTLKIDDAGDQANVSTITQFGWHQYDPDTGWTVFRNQFQLRAVLDWGTLQFQSLRYAFYNMYDALDFSVPSYLPSTVTDIGGMFDTCRYFTGRSIANWDVQRVTKFDYLFFDAAALKQNISTWNVSQAVSVDFMFSGACLKCADLQKWCFPLVPYRPAGFASFAHDYNATRQPRFGNECDTTVAHRIRAYEENLDTVRPMDRPADARVSPILECSGNLYTLDGITCYAVMGYNNPPSNGGVIEVPIGADNRFSPTPINRGQPTVFLSGRQVNVFSATFPCNLTTGSLTWALTGRTRTISLNRPRILTACPNACTCTAPIAAPVAAPVTPPIAAPVTPPIAAPVTPPIAGPVTPPIAAPVTPPIAAPVTPPIATPVDPPITPPVAAPVNAPVDPPLNAPMDPPITPPVAVPVTPPIAAPVSQPVSAPVSSPATIYNATGCLFADVYNLEACLSLNNTQIFNESTCSTLFYFGQSIRFKANQTHVTFYTNAACTSLFSAFPYLAHLQCLNVTNGRPDSVRFRNLCPPTLSAPIDAPVDPPVEGPVDPPIDVPLEAPVEPPANAPIEPPVEAPVEPPIDAPVDPPVDAPSDPPVEAPVEPPIDAPVDPPLDAPVDTPIEAPVEPPIDAPVDPPVDALVDPPVDAPIDAPIDTPVDPIVDAPVDTPVEAPVDSPIDAPVEPPIDTPIDAPIDTPVDPPTDPPVDAPVVPPIDAPVVPLIDAPVVPPIHSPVDPPIEAPVDSPVEPPATVPVSSPESVSNDIPVSSPSQTPTYPTALFAGALTYTLRVVDSGVSRVFVPLGYSTTVNLTVDCGGLFWLDAVSELDNIDNSSLTNGVFCDFAAMNLTLSVGDVLTFKVTPVSSSSNHLPQFGWSDPLNENWHTSLPGLEFVSMDSFGDTSQMMLQSLSGAFAGIRTAGGFSVPANFPASVSNLNAAFLNATTFNDQTIVQWDVSNVISMAYMFAFATSFNAPIGSWNIANINAPAGGFNGMFLNASLFDSDLTPWCVSTIPSTPLDFADAAPLPSNLYPRWGAQCGNSAVMPQPTPAAVGSVLIITAVSVSALVLLSTIGVYVLPLACSAFNWPSTL